MKVVSEEEDLRNRFRICLYVHNNRKEFKNQ